jgi:hypothetical protein
LADDASPDDINYADLRENTVVWAVNVPGESEWVASELDGPNGASTLLSSRNARAFLQFPVSRDPSFRNPTTRISFPYPAHPTSASK